MKLIDIASKYKTDKHEPHQYLESYEKHFSNYKDRLDVKKVVEIGISYGDSLLMWSEYFPNAEIIGADIFDYKKADYKVNIGGADGGRVVDRRDVLLNNPRIKTYVLDQTNEQSIKDFKCIIGTDCDIIIDDGGHSMEMHQKTLKILLPSIKSSGLYVIEDLHTCYPGFDNNLYGFPLIQQGDTITTMLLADLQRPKSIIPDTNYINKDEMIDIRNNITKVEVARCRISEISFIEKK